MGNRIPRRLDKYRRLALESGAAEAKLLPASVIVTAEWVRLKCQFGCSGYNKRLCCPPYTPTPETTRRVLGEYRHALIYAIDGHGDKRYRRRLQRELATIERTAFLDGLYRALALGAGPCRLCAECDTTQRCRHPAEARPSLESCGVDVYATCRNAGIRLEVVTSREQTPRYIHAVLLD
jgi:predicted metal-binding protein